MPALNFGEVGFRLGFKMAVVTMDSARSRGSAACRIACRGARHRGYSQLSVVPCLVNGFMPRVGRRW
jgi:hypothetical protein